MAELRMLLFASEENDQDESKKSCASQDHEAEPSKLHSKRIKIHYSGQTELISFPQHATGELITSPIRSVFKLKEQVEIGLFTLNGDHVDVDTPLEEEEYNVAQLRKRSNSDTDEVSGSDTPTSLNLSGIKKRKRRKASEIERSYKCIVSNCHKYYGSENALKMHTKLKHPEIGVDFLKAFIKDKINIPSSPPHTMRAITTVNPESLRPTISPPTLAHMSTNIPVVRIPSPSLPMEVRQSQSSPLFWREDFNMRPPSPAAVPSGRWIDINSRTLPSPFSRGPMMNPPPMPYSYNPYYPTGAVIPNLPMVRAE